MHETLNFLTIIDDKIKRGHLNENRKLHSLSVKDRNIRKINRYQYAKAMDFRQTKYSRQFPKWLTEKEGFTDFMYKNYEKKLMSIPLICQKTKRESDQKYFISLFLQKVDLFCHLPNQVTEVILQNLNTKYYKAGDVVHDQREDPSFMGIIYIGSVEYKQGKRTVSSQKNEVILKDAFLSLEHPTIRCKQETIILTLDRSIWQNINTIVKQQIQRKERDEIADMMRSTFFLQLHIKDKKAKQFYDCMKLECYFKGQVIQEAGSEEKVFCLLYKGSLQQQNHIFVREHNKWPMPHRRWEVRAVYNSYHQNKVLKRYDFFGDEEMVQNLKFRARYVARQWTILFKMSNQDFFSILNQEDIKRLKKYRAENADVNYSDFETEIRKRTQSTTNKKKIVLKAINTSLAHKSQFSPKKMELIGSYEKSMMKRATVFEENRTVDFG